MRKPRNLHSLQCKTSVPLRTIPLWKELKTGGFEFFHSFGRCRGGISPVSWKRLAQDLRELSRHSGLYKLARGTEKVQNIRFSLT